MSSDLTNRKRTSLACLKCVLPSNKLYMHTRLVYLTGEGGGPKLACGDLRGYADVEDVLQLLEEAKRRTDLAKEMSHGRHMQESADGKGAVVEGTQGGHQTSTDRLAWEDTQAGSPDQNRGHSVENRLGNHQRTATKDVRDRRSAAASGANQGAGRPGGSERSGMQDAQQVRSAAEGSVKADRKKQPAKFVSKSSDDDNDVRMSEALKKKVRQYEKTLHVDSRTMLRSERTRPHTHTRTHAHAHTSSEALIHAPKHPHARIYTHTHTHTHSDSVCW
jgi:hypothetical protein